MPAPYLDVEDLPGLEAEAKKAVTIKAIVPEMVDGRMHPVLYFNELDKGLVITREAYAAAVDFLGRSKAIEDILGLH